MIKHIVCFKKHCVTVAGYKTETDGDVTCVGSNLLSALFALLGKSFESGDGDGKKLDNDLRRDVRRYAESEKRALRKCRAGKHAHIIEKACLAVSGTKLAYVCERYGDNRTYTINNYYKKREKYF